MEIKVRIAEIMRRLQQYYPDVPVTYLNYNNAFEITIATILSAHTTDASVNSVTPDLFKKYPDALALMNANPEDVKNIIKSVGMYNRKTDYITSSAKTLVDEFNGEVPKSIAKLVKLRGVSRKTANVILQVAYGINEGVVVDTHIQRVTRRLKLTTEKAPEKIERELMELLPPDEWDLYAQLIGAHGRNLCSAKSPECAKCPINELCPSAEVRTN